MSDAAPFASNPMVRLLTVPLSVPFASDAAPSTIAMSPAAPGTVPAATPLVVQFAGSVQSPSAPPAQWNTRIASPSSSLPPKSEKRPVPVNEIDATPPCTSGADVRNHDAPESSARRTYSLLPFFTR